MLHVAGAEIATSLHDVLYAGGTTLVGAADAEASRWSLVRDRRLVPLVHASARVDPVLSDDGSRVAWVREIRSRHVREQVSDVTFRAVAYDVATGRRVGTWTTRNRVTCRDAVGWLLADRVLADGRVLLYRVAEDRLSWSPGHEPVEDASRTEWSPAPIRPPGGHAVAFLGDSDGHRYGTYPVSVPWVRRGGRLTRLAAPADSRVLAWEDDDHVLLATGAPVRFLRCTATTGACQETSDRPGPHVHLPGGAR